jgi:hypothetical protein
MNVGICLAMNNDRFVFNAMTPPKSKYDFLTFASCKLKVEDSIFCVQWLDVNH